MLILTVSLASPAPLVSAQGTSLISRIDPVTIARDWSDVELLYDEHFHDPVEVDEEIAHIHDSVPELVDVEVIGQSYEGRNITLVTITNEQHTVQKGKTLVVSQHHGREQISIEITLRFILRLLNDYGEDEMITNHVDTQEIYVIPMLNPDALQHVIHNGNHWLRKNLRPFDNDGDGQFDEDTEEDVNGDGHIAEYEIWEKIWDGEIYELNYVGGTLEGIDNDEDGLVNEDPVGLVDLNRNYPVGFGGPGASNDPLSQVYHGTSAFSEPETQVFRDFALQHRFAMAYSMHSGINATFFANAEYSPWAEPALYSQVIEDYQEILPSSFNEYYFYPQETHNMKESAFGGYWDDWMYYDRGTQLPVTFEIYHNGTVDEMDFRTVVEDNATHQILEWNGIYGYFNPVEAFIDDLWLDVLPGFEYLLDMTPVLDASLSITSGEVMPGSDLTLQASIDDLSYRLGTQEELYLIGEDGTELYSWPELSATATIDSAAFITLPEGLTGEDYTIKLGNNFTGFTHFVLTFQEGPVAPPLDPMLLLGVSIGVIAVVIILVVVLKRR
jgi:hypothetical protein